MKSQIHHAALNVSAFDWYTAFFQTVFGMTVQKTSGERPARKVWFHEGIQLNERTDAIGCGTICDHISLAVENIPEAVDAAINAGCDPLPEGAHWFALPNGVRLELKQM